MSTRSHIGIMQPDNTVKYIYCHFDGYYEGVGATLEEHYKDPQKVNALIDGGDISYLGDNIPSEELLEIIHTLKTLYYKENPRDVGEMCYHLFNPMGMTCSYNLWREEKCPPRFMPYDEFISSSDDGAEFAYVFNGEQWLGFEV